MSDFPDNIEMRVYPCAGIRFTDLTTPDNGEIILNIDPNLEMPNKTVYLNISPFGMDALITVGILGKFFTDEEYVTYAHQYEPNQLKAGFSKPMKNFGVCVQIHDKEWKCCEPLEKSNLTTPSNFGLEKTKPQQ